MPVVISDTSPVRALHHVGALSLLPDPFGVVYVPPAVVRELSAPRDGGAPVDATQFSFIQVRAPSNVDQLRALSGKVDEGEREAIALAIELGASLVLIDERRGRAVAEQAGLTVVGALGVLLREKQRGLVGPLAPLLDRLRDELNFYIGDALREHVLRRAGE